MIPQSIQRVPRPFETQTTPLVGYAALQGAQPIVLPDDNVLYVGGRSGTNQGFIVDYKTGTATATATLTSILGQGASDLSGIYHPAYGVIIIGASSTSSGATYPVVIGNVVAGRPSRLSPEIAAGTWTTSTSAPDSLVLTGKVCIPQTAAILVFGGITGSSRINDKAVYLFNIEAATWSLLTTCPISFGTDSCAVCLVPNTTEILVFPGYSTGYGGSGTAVYRYNYGTNVWTLDTPLPAPAVGGSMVRRGTNIVFIANGDRAYGSSSPGIYEYTPTTKTWATITPPANFKGARGVVALSTGEIIFHEWLSESYGDTVPATSQAIVLTRDNTYTTRTIRYTT